MRAHGFRGMAPPPTGGHREDSTDPYALDGVYDRDLSKRMTGMLRHDRHIGRDAEGYVRLQDVLAACGATQEEIITVVRNSCRNGEKRFELAGDRIRARRRETARHPAHQSTRCRREPREEEAAARAPVQQPAPHPWPPRAQPGPGGPQDVADMDSPPPTPRPQVQPTGTEDLPPPPPLPHSLVTSSTPPMQGLPPQLGPPTGGNAVSGQAQPPPPSEPPQLAAHGPPLACGYPVGGGATEGQAPPPSSEPLAGRATPGAQATREDQMASPLGPCPGQEQFQQGQPPPPPGPPPELLAGQGQVVGQFPSAQPAQPVLGQAAASVPAPVPPQPTSGVTAAELEALWREVERLRSDNVDLRRENAGLRAGFEQLHRRVEDLAAWMLGKDPSVGSGSSSSGCPGGPAGRR
mmetsp:Transcript_44898/g.134196  ORF Transcript_44898/g.134196 Transcript_44898/m.134196 type:complete len:407 (+) Transcript_44898:73-1293(+)